MGRLTNVLEEYSERYFHDFHDEVKMSDTFDLIYDLFICRESNFKYMWDGHLEWIKNRAMHWNKLCKSTSSSLCLSTCRSGNAQVQENHNRHDARGQHHWSRTKKWASPIVLVPKEYKTLRFRPAYRSLNTVTKWSLSLRVDKCIDLLGDAFIFSTLEASRVLWEMKVERSDRSNTVIKTHDKSYCFIHMLLGLGNTLETIQRKRWMLCYPQCNDNLHQYF